MSSGFAFRTTQLLLRIKHFRMQFGRYRRGTLFDHRRHPQADEQPEWAHVPDRVWRRHSMLLMCLHEMHRGMGHE